MMRTEAVTIQTAGRQRADLTFKYNKSEGRHGWLRLTPAYSVRIVEEILKGKESPCRVLDPFSGTATTPLCASMMGHHSVSVEINPFLVWFGRVKTAIYSSRILDRATEYALKISHVAAAGKIKPSPPPQLHNIDRWWNSKRLQLLCRLKSSIIAIEPEMPEIHDLMSVAFCRTAIRISNAAFNHQSMSFRQDNGQLPLWDDPDEKDCGFLDDALYIIETAKTNPLTQPQVIAGDSIMIGDLLDERFDLLITSPPYPNRMSYIRELRPYMYWLGYLTEARDAGELDWKTIGGTWGIATSRLTEWRRDGSVFIPASLSAALGAISSSDSKSGVILAKYIEKYFEDISRHIASVRKLMNNGAHVHYIVGNSKFYDVVIPVEKYFRELLSHAGFNSADFRPIRKRNSKKELFEFDVYATA